MASTTPLTVDTFSYDDFHLGPRFTELRPIGYGANGLVVAATDGMSGQTVAVKRLVAGGDDDRRCRQVRYDTILSPGTIRYKNVCFQRRTQLALEQSLGLPRTFVRNSKQ